MLYILAYEELGNHPKTLRCARALGINRAQMVGHLYFLWVWCLHYAPDGDVTRYENADLAHAAEWEGDADKFVQALIGCGIAEAPGWMEEKEGRLMLHDWDDYGGKVLQGREKHAEVMRQRREKARDNHVTITRQSREELLPSRDPILIVEEVKELKEESINPPVSPRGGQAEPKPKKPRATQLAPDWKPSGECIQHAISRRYDLWVNLTEATAEFVEYWTEGEGAGQSRINWELTWKNRIKDLAERAEARGVKTNGHNRNPIPGARTVAALADIERRAKELAEEGARLDSRKRAC